MSAGVRSNTVLVISADPLVPVSAGGAARLFQMTRYLREAGFRVELLTPYFGPRASAELRRRVDALHVCGGPLAAIGEWSKEFLPAALFQKVFSLVDKRLRQSDALRRAELLGVNSSSFIIRKINPRLCDAARPLIERIQPRAVIGNYAWTAKAVEQAPPGTLRIIDTHDIQHLRRGRAQEAGSDLPGHACTREEEVRELSRADVLLAIQRHERAQLQEMCPGQRVILVEHAEDAREALPSPADSMTVLFVGSHYDPNVQGIRRFMETAWREIRAAMPDAKLDVCGTVCNAIAPAPEGVTLLGRVPALDPHYRQAAVVINPVPYGSGMKIKSVEALAFGKCLVTTPSGVTGLEDEPGAPFVITRVETMAAPILALLRDPARRAQVELRTHEFARERFSARHVYQELEAVLRGDA